MIPPADAFTALAVAAGLFVFAAGTAGLLRFPDAPGRLHALTKAGGLGLGLVVLGLLPRAEGVLGALKLLLVWGLVLLAGAAAGQMIARRARAEAGADAGPDAGAADAPR